MFKLIFKLAFRNLFRNRRRTLITVASVFFAVILAVVMQSVQVGTYDVMIRNVAGFYTGYVQVHQKGYWNEQTLDNSMEWGTEDDRFLTDHKEIVAVAPRIESFVLASSDSATRGVLLVGIDPEQEHRLTGIRNKLSEGKFLGKASDGIMLAEGLAAQLGVKTGDTLVLLGQGYQAMSAAGKYPVVGILRLGSPVLNKRMGYLHIEEAQNLLSMQGRLTAVALSVEDAEDASTLAMELRNHFDEETFEVMDWTEMLPELVQGIEADRVSGSIMQAVLYIIISFGMFGTVLMMLSERNHEFGVVTAVGMKKNLLNWVLRTELAFISLAGAFLGMLGAIPVVLWLHYRPLRFRGELEDMMERYDMEPILQAAISPDIFVRHTIIVAVIALLISLYPAYKIRKLNTIEALRNL